MTSDQGQTETGGLGAGPVPPQPALALPPPSPPPRRTALPLFFAALVVLNILLLGVVIFLLRAHQQGAAAADRLAESRVMTLAHRVDALEAVSGKTAVVDASLGDRIAALESQPKAALPAAQPGVQPGAAPNLDALTARVAALEAKPAPDATAQNALQQRVAALEAARLTQAAETAARIDAFGKDLQETVKPQLAALAQAAPQQVTKGELQSVLGRLTALESGDDRKTVKMAASALAVSVLAEAVRAGTPYSGELAAVSRLASPQIAGAPALDTLGRQANTGLPTIEQLTAAFPAAARQARAADEPREPREPGMIGTLRRTFGDLVSIRTPGASTDMALDTMAKALRREDLAQALAAAQDLDPKPRAALEPWLARARLRQSGMAAVETLRASAVRDLAAAATP